MIVGSHCLAARFTIQIRRQKPKYVSGESHYFQGVPYQLCVVERKGNARVVFRRDQTIELHIEPRSSAVRRERALINWYRAYLKRTIPPLIKKWEKIIGVEVAEWGVKRMKTRWGSCNTNARRIWLNLELAKKSPECLEYVVVHEMVHLLERSHNRRFKEFLSQFLPRWRSVRKELKHMA